MKKIRKKISIDDFMKLWKNSQDGKWDLVMPNWGEEIKEIWKDEITKKFQMAKRYEGSYGHVGDEMLKTLASHTEQTYLPTVPYKRKMVIPGVSQDYIKDFPISYVWRGHLRKEMGKESSYEHKQEEKSMSLKVNIPMAPADSPPGAYEFLEQNRSYIKSSFVLAWPEILKKTLEIIGG